MTVEGQNIEYKSILKIRSGDKGFKNLIALGLIAQHKKLLSTELDVLLQLDDNKRQRAYTDKLVELGIVVTRGIKKGNRFLVNPQVVVNSKK